jgi:hypothetical protein
MKATYFIHEKGLRMCTDELGWFIIFFTDLENIVFTSGVV